MDEQTLSALLGVMGTVTVAALGLVGVMFRRERNHKGHNPGNPNGIVAEVRRCHEAQMAKHDQGLEVVNRIEILLRERLPRPGG
jgi:hypothetical protein